MRKISDLKINPRHLWALFSTLSAALSTVVYLYFFWERSDSASFTHLYSISMMFSGWLNTFSFLGGTRRWLAPRMESLFLCVVCILGIPALRWFIFQEGLHRMEWLFVLGCSSLTWMTPQLRSYYEIGQFRKAYAITIAMNLWLLVAAFAGVLLGQEAVLYILTSFSTVLALLFISILRPESGALSSVPTFSFAYVFNPSVLLLERVLFDQKLLVLSGAVSLTILYYLCGRLINFMGTLSFTVSMEKAMRGVSGRAMSWIFLLLGVVVFALSFTLGTKDVFWASLLSQLSLWLVVFWVTPLAKSRFYPLLFSLCITEAIFRWYVLGFTESYVPWILRGMGVFLFVLCFMDRHIFSSKQGMAKMVTQ